VALRAVRAVHARDPHAWCAWVTDATQPQLYAPAVAQAGVDLERLLVVRPEPCDLARTAVKAASSGAFELIVVDALSGFYTRKPKSSPAQAEAFARGSGHSGRVVHGALVVRKLALAALDSGTSSLLLTSVWTPRSLPWPVALRMEVERRPDSLVVRMTKDRTGQAHSQHIIRMDP